MILPVVYLGILKFIDHLKIVGYLLDFISSIFLLWATFTQLSSLIIDMLFQFAVFCWACINSCYFARMKEYAEKLSSYHILCRIKHKLQPSVKTPIHWLKFCVTVLVNQFQIFIRTLCSLLAWIFPSAIIAGLWSFLVTAFRTVVMFAIGSLHLVCFCTVLVVRTFVEAWHAYVIHFQNHLEHIEHVIEPVQVQLVYQEAHQEHATWTEQNQSEVVFPSHNVLMPHNRDISDPCFVQCRLLEETILRQQSVPRINDPSLDILPFALIAFGSPDTFPHLTAALAPVPSTFTTAPKGVHVPPAQERDSSGLCRFAISPHTESSDRSQSSTSLLQQTLPVTQQETIISPSLPRIKSEDDPKSMVVV